MSTTSEPSSATIKLPVEEKRKKKNVELKRWNAVAVWSWDITVDTCAICRNHIMELCIECEANQTGPAASEACSVAWGTCNHAFHYHCIRGWLKSRKCCPLDNLDWDYQKHTR